MFIKHVMNYYVTKNDSEETILSTKLQRMLIIILQWTLLNAYTHIKP